MCLPLGTTGGDGGAWEVQDLLCAAHLTQLALITLSTLHDLDRPPAGSGAGARVAKLC